jgi:Cu(I)/Ag(I) efflux system membrane fusion protein
MNSLFPQARVLLAAMCLLAACSKAPERTPKFYQSPMHPWITSDKPGSCTICGMQLVPVYEETKTSPLAAGEIEVSPRSISLLGAATAPVTKAPVTREIRVSGILEDDDTQHRVVAAFYEGRIERVYVQQTGQRVRAGQPLASIYSPELLYVVREFQNAVQRGKNDPIAVNARNRLIQYGLAPAQVDGLANQPRDLYAIDLLAPADGTVLVRNAWQGQYVKNGEPLFETGNLARMWFKAELYERDIASVRLGQKAVVTSPAAPGRTFDGMVTFLDPSFDPATRSTKVRIEVNNPPADEQGTFERVLPHRAYAEATIAASGADVLSVPRTALLRDGRREVVYVEKSPGRFEMRAVRAGRTGDDRVEIVEGLKEGEMVVVNGNLMIDAEAQLRQGASPTPAMKPLSEKTAALLKTMAAISQFLAHDTIPAAADVPHPDDLPSGISFPHDLAPMGGATLADWRRSFLPWSTAAADLALALKSAGYEVPVVVMECPMTGSSFPGAPKQARWVQAGEPVENPYLGEGMLDCGSEVQP